MPGYYTDKLSAGRLRSCYELAPPRTKAYLEAEIDFVLQKASSCMVALELGCGYGRVLRRLLPRVRIAVGIDISLASLGMAVEFAGPKKSLYLAAMDATRMGFRDGSFDLTLCIQNESQLLGSVKKSSSRRLLVSPGQVVLSFSPVIPTASGRNVSSGLRSKPKMG